jgi:hypothetical protein
MSDTPAVVPATSAEGRLASWLHAAEHGAAIIYNDVVHVANEVSTWTSSHPEIGPLIAAGETFAKNLLVSAGVPLPELVTVETLIVSALKRMAAQDASVSSGH